MLKLCLEIFRVCSFCINRYFTTATIPGGFYCHLQGQLGGPLRSLLFKMWILMCIFWSKAWKKAWKKVRQSPCNALWHHKRGVFHAKQHSDHAVLWAELGFDAFERTVLTDLRMILCLRSLEALMNPQANLSKIGFAVFKILLIRTNKLYSQ